MACHFEAINEGMMVVGPDSAELTKRHAGGKLCCASDDVVATLDPDGYITATVVNGSLDVYKEITFPGCGKCVEAVLYTSDSVLPPSAFETKNILDDIRGGTVQMPPHSVMLLRFRYE